MRLIVRAAALALAATMLMALPLVGCQRYLAEPVSARTVEIAAIVVGKGDAIVVRVGEDDYLIDAGKAGKFDALTAALDELGVKRLRGVFLTHTDSDHGGGMKKLAQSDLPIDAWYAPALYVGKKPEKHQAHVAASIRGMEVNWLRAGDVIEIDADSRFEVLAPLTLDEDDEDNNSLVMRLVAPEGTALLAGDIENRGQRALLASGAELKSDYLKVPNHGDGDAAYAPFIAAVGAQVAVVSTDSAEKEDTPDPAALKTLQAAGAQVYVTQDFGKYVRVRLSGGRAALVPEEQP
ncbi:MAG: MBL fold metallo-hydrolase [Clostridiales bacterium]|nr:MBL fold metallo-hydrolase [Clostridiales bacterium]